MIRGTLYLAGLSAFLLVSIASFSNPAKAACSNGRCWGAVGIGSGGAWGNAFDYPSQRAAVRAVQNRCRGRCTTIKSFYNACGALAQGNNGGWGWAWHRNAEEAKSRAIAYCVPNGRNCAIKSWACTSR